MNAPKYDLRINPVYQVDFQASSKGKRVSATKRRVTFKFGFSNAEAIAQGLSGIHCRGEEHEVTLVWSLTSGKRLIVADDVEVHFSQGRRSESRFEASWSMAGGHELKLIANAMPQVFGTTVGFRQYDLQLDGMSYFDMPQIFELGIVNGVDIANRRSAPAAATTTFSPPRNNFALPPREETWNSPPVRHYETQHYMNRGPSVQEPRELPPSPAPVVSRAESMPTDMLSDPTPINHFQDHISAPVALIDQSSISVSTQFSAPPQVVDEFTPRPPEPPTFEAVTNNIMSAYAPPSTPALPALMNAPAHSDEVYDAQPAQPVYETGPTTAYEPAVPQPAYHAPAPAYHSPAAAYQAAPPAPAYQPPAPAFQPPVQQPATPTAAPHPVLTMNSPTSVLNMDDEPRDDVDRAVKSLVNLDDITDKPMSPEMLKLTMMKEEKEDKKKKSKGLPPSKPAWHLGGTPTLGEIQAHATKVAPSKEVMRTHAFDANAAQSGMMVVYGATPPPMQQQQQQQQQAYIPQAAGFGAGVYHQPTYTHYGQQAAY